MKRGGKHSCGVVMHRKPAGLHCMLDYIFDCCILQSSQALSTSAMRTCKKRRQAWWWVVPNAAVSGFMLIVPLVLQVMQSAHNTYHRTWSGDTETLVLLEPQVNRLIRW